MTEQANKYEDIIMLEQHRYLANKYKDIVNLQGRRHIVAAARLQLVHFKHAGIRRI